MKIAQLQIPALGWRMAFDPCSECLSIVEREAETNVYAGQQHDCYACQNRLTVQRIERDGPSMTDMLSAFTREGDQPREWTLASLSFHDNHFTRSGATDWIASYELEGFPAEPTKRAMEWSIFEKTQSTEDSALVPLGDGVIGLCILVESK